VAHDIRTPLTSVKMNLEIIRGQSGMSADLVECADMALDEVKRMNDYVSGMLDYLKPIQLRAVEFDVRGLLDETLRTMQPLLDSRKVRVRSETCLDEPLPNLKADASRLKQVLMNLLENAADASSPGQLIQLSVAYHRPGQLTICVKDEGHGIAPSNLEKVFDPFFTTRDSGTGLGLAIVRKLVRAHGGEVQVTSKPGEGSAFTVSLPTWSLGASVPSYA
jgi:signal transduction histidine kinase